MLFDDLFSSRFVCYFSFLCAFFFLYYIFVSFGGTILRGITHKINTIKNIILHTAYVHLHSILLGLCVDRCARGWAIYVGSLYQWQMEGGRAHTLDFDFDVPASSIRTKTH